MPNYRTKVQYIPQRPSLLPGTPLDFLNRIKSFQSRKPTSNNEGKEGLDPYRIAEEWGIERTMWAREWSTLSGGEGQRIALAIAVGIGGAEVVLLDGESFFVSWRREGCGTCSGKGPRSCRPCSRIVLIWSLGCNSQSLRRHWGIGDGTSLMPQNPQVH